jgi:uncharacterized protein YecT (DUF1311 family)
MAITRFATAAAVLVGALAGSAMAQAPQGVSAAYVACHERAKGNTVQDNICAQGEMAAQDARLNKAYQQVMRQLAKDPAKKLALRDEERSWINKRDYDCKVDEHTTNEGCLVVKTAMRANELEKQVHF